MPAFPEFVAMIASLMAMSALSIDVMLPALPAIDAAFAVTGTNDRQLVVTDYVLGFAIGQLFYGPLSDRFGRRAVLIAGLILYTLATVACLVADSFALLLVARFVQGFGAASPRVIALAVVRDVYSGRRMAEVMSFVMSVFVLVPVVAPAIGAGWMALGSWSTIFVFLVAVGAGLIAWMGMRLPETRPVAKREPLSMTWVLGAYWRTITTPQAIGYTLAASAIFGTLMAYINLAQQVFVDVYGLGPWFPLAFGAISVAVAGAIFINGRLVGRLGMRKLAHGALLLFVAVAALHLALAWPDGKPPLMVFGVLLAICLCCFGVMMPNYNALAMEPMGAIAGTASSFVGASTTGIGAILGWFVGQRFAGDALPLLEGYLGFAVLSLVFVLITERGRLFGIGRADEDR